MKQKELKLTVAELLYVKMSVMKRSPKTTAIKRLQQEIIGKVSRILAVGFGWSQRPISKAVPKQKPKQS